MLGWGGWTRKVSPAGEGARWSQFETHEVLEQRVGHEEGGLFAPHFAARGCQIPLHTQSVEKSESYDVSGELCEILTGHFRRPRVLT